MQGSYRAHYLIYLVLLPLISLNNAFADESLVIFGVQAPAWIERNGERLAAKPSMSVHENDTLIAGQSGKLWLKMPDDAKVKLGNKAKAKLNSTSISAKQDDTGEDFNLLNLSIDILEGAFRYTTGLADSSWQRDVQFGLRTTATIGIRGTDLWGRVDDDEQFVVLLEGSISIKPSDGSTPVTLDTPLQIYKAQSQVIDSVTMDAVQTLAPETELDFGNGVTQQGGSVIANLASFKRARYARRMVDSLAQKGFAAESNEVSIDEEIWYRVSIYQLSSLSDGSAILDKLSDENGINSPWLE